MTKKKKESPDLKIFGTFDQIIQAAVAGNPKPRKKKKKITKKKKT